MRAGKCLAIVPSLCLGKWDPGVMVKHIFEVCLSFGRGAKALPSCIKHDSDGVRGMSKSQRYCWIDWRMGIAGRRCDLQPYCPHDGPLAGLSLLGMY